MCVKDREFGGEKIMSGIFLENFDILIFYRLSNSDTLERKYSYLIGSIS